MTQSTRKVVKLLWRIFFALVGVVILTFILISTGIIGYMPPISDLQNPIDKYASQVISEDGVVLGNYAHKNNNRLFVTYKDLAPNTVEALIATEDKRFKDHAGIDGMGILRAFVKTGILRQKHAGGGSTITQQLAKQLYSPKAKNIFERALQKPIEWVIATKLERFYTKEEIVTLYLNQFDFLYQAVGIQSAAQTYFDKEPKDLNVEESAVLIGMAKNPSYYNPRRNPDRALARRNTVLDLMKEQNYLSAAETDSLKALPLKIKFNRQTHKSGLAPYFREYLRRIMMAKKPKESDYRGWQKEDYKRDLEQWENNPLYGWCNKNKKANGEPYDIYTDGLKIYTGINSRMQQHAEQAMLEYVSLELQPEFNREKSGRSYAPFSKDISQAEREEIISRAIKLSDRYRFNKEAGMSERENLATFDKKTEMEVLAYAKGKAEIINIDTVMTPRDSILYYKKFLRSGMMAMDAITGEVRAYVGGVDYATWQYDMAGQGRRQVGSTMKPLLYSMAMNEGFTPCDGMIHSPQHIRTESGEIWSPKNVGAKNVGGYVSINWGLQNSSNWVTAWLMSQMSPYAFVELLRSFGITGTLDPVMSISLGTPDICVSEMVSAFTTFANAGIRANPIFVTRIEDQYGNTIATFDTDYREVLSPEAAYKTLYMLRNVMNGGTGGRVRTRYGIEADMGGKTGTTQNHSDGWFMCFTPRISTGCWVGGEDRSIHFDSIRDGQGASTSLPIIALFFKKIYADAELQKRAEALGISPDLKFEIPEEFADPCKRDSEESVTAPTVHTEEEIDDLFQ